MIIRTEIGYQEILFHPKSANSYAVAFAPDPVLKKVISVEENGAEYFFDVSGQKYNWIDQLRTSHAQRAVELFASDLSRVGLTESEWIRRLNRK